MGLAWLAGSKQSERARARRRAYPIHFYVGRNGSGKTLAAVYDTLPDLDAGMHVLSTVRLLDFRNPRPCDDDNCTDLMHGSVDHMAAHPLYVPFTTWPQLLKWSKGAVIMDEITGVADSNDSAALPTAAGNHLAQLRRGDCAVRITGLNFIRANKRIREAVNAVTRCQSSLPVTVYHEDGTPKLWRARRLAVWKTYDAQSLPMDDISEGAWAKAERLVGGRHWIPSSLAIQAYDTYAPVLHVGTVSEAGRCAYCGGTRRAPECSCSDYQSAKTVRRNAAPQTRSGEERRTGPRARPLMAVHDAGCSGER
jgi:Zonular occludens toxin (Zot)